MIKCVTISSKSLSSRREHTFTCNRLSTLPLAQLLFFHILLIKKGISTYDYIISLRDQEQQGVSGLFSLIGKAQMANHYVYYVSFKCNKGGKIEEGDESDEDMT